MSYVDQTSRRTQVVSTTRLAAVLAALSMLSAFSIDTFYPSLRAMQTEFDVDALVIQQLLTAYMVPYAAMSLVHGALSDAVGRRRVALVGLVVYVLASFSCVLAPNYGAILAFRAVQGLTAGVGMTIGRAVIRDLYEGHEAQRLMSIVMMVFGVAPAIAPVVGGWVHVAWGWRGVFGFLGLLSLALAVASYFYLPETHPREKRTALRPLVLIGVSAEIIRDSRFLWLALCNSALFATLWIYIGAAPRIVIDAWGLSETQFGMFFFPIIGGYIAGSLCSGRAAGRLRPQAQLQGSIAIAVLSSVLGCTMNLVLDTAPMLATQFTLATTAFSLQFGSPVLALKALDLYPRARGAVSSLLTFIQLTGATLVLAIAPAVPHDTIAAFALGTALLAAAFALLAKSSERKALRLSVQPSTPDAHRAAGPDGQR
ncbi:MAG TPA: multidrug effflux MFS transporter [Steroidobacteraceae bacterium]|nr:multidrug effflux MFS transporter [Steroidobacteraceae bacterium]